MKRRLRLSLWGIGAALLCGGAVSAWLLPRSMESDPHPPEMFTTLSEAEENHSNLGITAEGDAEAEGADSPLPEAPTAPDQLTPRQIERLVSGAWTSEYYGTRYLTIRNDGSATVLFQANTLASMFVGRLLKIEYTWEYDSQHMQVVFRMEQGAPEQGAEYVAKLWGKLQKQDVISVCREQLHMRDLDGKTEHHWKRVDTIPRTFAKKFDKL